MCTLPHEETLENPGYRISEGIPGLEAWTGALRSVSARTGSGGLEAMALSGRRVSGVR